MDGETFVAALVKVADADGFVGGVPACSMRKCDPMHELCKVAIVFWPEDEVPVVGHDAVRTYSHVGKFLALCENVFEGVEILVFFENVEAAVSAVEDVIDDIAFIYTYWSWHNRRL